MKAFAYVRPHSLAAAVRVLAEGDVVAKAAGVDLLDRMKERVDEPARVLALADVGGLDAIARLPDGGVRVGALATLARVAASPEVRDVAPALATAAGEAASPPLRNRATVGGNLAQHTRCGYYRHASFPCLKRGAERCPVLEAGAVQETAGVFGVSACASAHPSSLAPAIGAVGGTVVVHGPDGERRLALADLYEAPRRGKASDTTLRPGDVIVAVDLPPRTAGVRTAYLEVRQRAAFDWALVSCAVAIVGGESAVKEARVWLGAVAPTPWRSVAAERALAGGPFTEARAALAGDAAAAEATPLPGNAYKVDLVRVVVRRALVAAFGSR